MSPRHQGSAAVAFGRRPTSAETPKNRTPALRAAMRKGGAAARALLVLLDADDPKPAELARASHRAHQALAELWTLAEADLARRGK